MGRGYLNPQPLGHKSSTISTSYSAPKCKVPSVTLQGNVHLLAQIQLLKPTLWAPMQEYPISAYPTKSKSNKSTQLQSLAIMLILHITGLAIILS